MKIKFASVLLLSSLCACSAKIESGPPFPGSIGPTTDDIAPSQRTNTQLEGKWQLGCTVVSGSMAMAMEAEFRGDDFSSQLRLYSDAGCAALVQQQDVSGKFSVPESGKLNSVLSTGEKSFDIYLIEGDALYFGTQAGDTEAQRPTQLNRQMKLRRL